MFEGNPGSSYSEHSSTIRRSSAWFNVITCRFLETIFWGSGCKDWADLVWAILGHFRTCLLTLLCKGKGRRYLVGLLPIVNMRHSYVIYDVDYGHSCTVPIAGETLSEGQFLRWFFHRLYMVSFRVRPFGHWFIDSQYSQVCTTGSAGGFSLMAGYTASITRNWLLPYRHSHEDPVGCLETTSGIKGYDKLMVLDNELRVLVGRSLQLCVPMFLWKLQ